MFKYGKNGPCRSATVSGSGFRRSISAAAIQLSYDYALYEARFSLAEPKRKRKPNPIEERYYHCHIWNNGLVFAVADIVASLFYTVVEKK
jgi:hypothetical protein